jgi:hypothetical protein
MVVMVTMVVMMIIVLLLCIVIVYIFSYGVIIMFVIDYVYVDLRCHVTWTVVELILVFGW